MLLRLSSLPAVKDEKRESLLEGDSMDRWEALLLFEKLEEVRGGNGRDLRLGSRSTNERPEGSHAGQC